MQNIIVTLILTRMLSIRILFESFTVSVPCVFVHIKKHKKNFQKKNHGNHICSTFTRFFAVVNKILF